MSKANKAAAKLASVRLTTPDAASRVQGTVARHNGGVVPKGSQVGRMQRAAVRNFGASGKK